MDHLAIRGEYLLANFPGLWEMVHGQVEDIIEGGSAGDFTTTGRYSGGTHGDPTGKRAIHLYEINNLAGELWKVRSWIDTQLPPGDRPLLVAAWRAGPLGWRWVARELRTGVAECIDRWSHLCNNLQVILDR